MQSHLHLPCMIRSVNFARSWDSRHSLYFNSNKGMQGQIQVGWGWGGGECYRSHTKCENMNLLSFDFNVRCPDDRR